MSMSEAGDILDEATKDVPEEIMDNEQVENAMQYLFDTLATLTDWIDPDSDGYREELSDMEHKGAVAVAEYYRKSLEDALAARDEQTNCGKRASSPPENLSSGDGRSPSSKRPRTTTTPAWLASSVRKRMRLTIESDSSDDDDDSM